MPKFLTERWRVKGEDGDGNEDEDEDEDGGFHRELDESMEEGGALSSSSSSSSQPPLKLSILESMPRIWSLGRP